MHLCSKQDPSTLTTTRIADEVGMSQGALFKHFPNKSSLWESVAGWVAGQLTDQVFGIADRHEQADQALEAMFLAHIGFIARHPGIPRLMLGELQKPGNQPAKRIVRQTLALYRQKIVALLNLGIEQKCITPTIDTEAAAVLYIGAIQGLVVQAMVGGDIASIEQTAPASSNCSAPVSGRAPMTRKNKLIPVLALLAEIVFVVVMVTLKQPPERTEKQATPTPARIIEARPMTFLTEARGFGQSRYRRHSGGITATGSGRTEYPGTAGTGKPATGTDAKGTGARENPGGP